MNAKPSRTRNLTEIMDIVVRDTAMRFVLQCGSGRCCSVPVTISGEQAKGRIKSNR